MENKKILLVDDESDIREAMIFYLKRLGFKTIFEAKDVSSATKRLNASTINLLITDLNMPNMNGSSLIKETKLKNPNIKIIVFSAATYEEIKNLEVYSLIDGIIHKPINYKDLEKAFNTFLNQAA